MNTGKYWSSCQDKFICLTHQLMSKTKRPLKNAQMQKYWIENERLRKQIDIQKVAGSRE